MPAAPRPTSAEWNPCTRSPQRARRSARAAGSNLDEFAIALELLKAEQERGPDFLRLANALSALYPKGSEEKRLLDAMLLAVPR